MSRRRRCSKDDKYLLLVDFHTPDQSAKDCATGPPLGGRQSTVYFRPEVLQLADDQPEGTLLGGVVSEVWETIFYAGHSLFHAHDPGFELFLPKHSRRITINQPGAAVAQFTALRPPALGRLPLGATPGGGLPLAIVRLEPLGVCQQPTDFRPDDSLHQVGAPLCIRTNPVPPEPIGLGPQTAIIRLGAGGACATTRAHRFPVIRITTYFADQQALAEIAAAPLSWPGAPAILG
jgi:hypothetical protein